MKKGLLLALTMVALVAISLPAGAIAPVIEPLPSVIIGDTGDISGTDAAALHLYRYTNIMNIATSNKITWGNADLGFGDAQKHAYYMSSDPAVKAYTASSEVAQVTAGDIAAIQTSGTKPAASKEITGTNFFWLSLANNLSGAANVYTATAAANGLTAAQFTPSADPATFTLVLADGDFPTTAVAQTDFSVYTVAGSDDGFSGAAVKVYGADFATGSDNWVWKDTVGFGSPTHAATGGALTAKLGTDTSKVYFGTWTTGDGSAPKPAIAVDSATMNGNVYRGTFTMTSTAADPLNTPGFRLFYQSEAFTHMGGISSDSTNLVASGNTIAPSTAGAKDVVLYWAVPFTLTEFGDTGKLATVQAGHDYRDYFLAFDMVGYESSDSGTVGLDNVNIEIIARPASGASLANWGAGGLAFNSSIGASGWVAGTTDANTGLGKGTATLNANTIVMTATASGATKGYQKVGPYASATLLPAWTSDKIVRANVTIASTVANASPTIRILTLASKADGNLQSLIWVDVFDPSVAKGLWTPTGNTAAGAPVAGGSNLDVYAYTHTAPTGANAGVLDPQIDCYTVGPAVFTQTNTAWPADTATLTISKFLYEECAAQ